VGILLAMHPTGFPFLDDGGPVLAFAHRGGARHPDLLGRENTMAAFRHAAALGYRYLETDVHLTRDGVLVAFHDTLLDRVSDGVGSIGALDIAGLAGVRVAGEEVPTLAEVVDAFPDARFNLDLKADAAVEPLAAFVVERGLHDRVMVGSFSWRRLRRFRALVGTRVPTSAAPVEVAAYAVLPGRVARRLAPRVAALQVPHRLRRLPVTTARLVRRAHRVGVQVHVWTVDDPDQMRALLALEVDGLMTDRTDVLAAVLRERGLWPGAGAP
jgi:glycerophosphoryl diester phosphodiesterase